MGDLIDDCRKVVLGHAVAALLFGVVYGWGPVIAMACMAAFWCALLGAAQLFGWKQWTLKP